MEQGIKVWVWPDYEYTTSEDGIHDLEVMLNTRSDDYATIMMSIDEFIEFEKDPKVWYTINIDQKYSLE